MRLPNGQGLLHECQVFRNLSHVLAAVASLAVQTIHHCRTPHLEASGCVVGNPETILLTALITGCSLG